jgi:hypothetical protein
VSPTSKDKKNCQPCSVVVQSAATSPRYSITISARHVGRRRNQVQHTFLLDQSNGRIWEMFCRKGSQEVEFRRIQVEGMQDSTDAPVVH